MNLLPQWRIGRVENVFLSCGVILAMVLFQAPPAMSDATTDGSNGVLTLWSEGESGERLSLRGRVITPQGKPVSGAQVEFRQADGQAQYTPSYQGLLTTTDRGDFHLQTVVPGQYTSAKHIHIRVSHPGHQTRTTEILFKGDPNINFGQPGALEVVLERVHQENETVSVGGVEIVLDAK